MPKEKKIKDDKKPTLKTPSQGGFAEPDPVKLRLAELEAEIAQLPTVVERASSVPLESLPAPSKKQEAVKAVQSSKAGSSSTLVPFVILVVLSLTLCNMPVISWLFAPINQFVVFIHELSHALAAIATGGHVTGLTFVPDGQGHGGWTTNLGGIQFLVTQAGYLGTTFVGCLLIYLGQFPRLSRYILVSLGALMAIATLFLIVGNLLNTGIAGILSAFWGFAIAVGLIWCGVKLKGPLSNWALLFLAIQTALNSITAVQYVAMVSMGLIPNPATSDAYFMQQMTMIPAGFWGLLWVLISVTMVTFTLWITYGPRRINKIGFTKLGITKKV